MEKARENILEKAEELFFRFGLRRITMNDIAEDLSMSKKTLYQHFKDKTDLVKTVTENYLNKEKDILENISREASDPVQEILMISNHLQDMFQRINPGLIFDTRRYYTEAWEIFLNFKEGYVRDMLVQNLKRGVEEGLYREEIDVELMATFRVAQVQMGFDPEYFPPGSFDLGHLQVQFIQHFLYGICTLKGHQLINDYISREND